MSMQIEPRESECSQLTKSNNEVRILSSFCSCSIMVNPNVPLFHFRIPLRVIWVDKNREKILTFENIRKRYFIKTIHRVENQWQNLHKLLRRNGMVSRSLKIAIIGVSPSMTPIYIIYCIIKSSFAENVLKATQPFRPTWHAYYTRYSSLFQELLYFTAHYTSQGKTFIKSICSLTENTKSKTRPIDLCYNWWYINNKPSDHGLIVIQ